MTIKGFILVCVCVFIYVNIYMKICSFLLKSEPAGTLDVWYMKQNIDYSKQQISLFWKVSFPCQLEIQENYIFVIFFVFIEI